MNVNSGGLMLFCNFILLVSLSVVAFFFSLQDPTTRFLYTIHHLPRPFNSSSLSCAGLASGGPSSFPYYRNLKFALESNLKPKICITSTTYAGLDQILPWIYYHKVIGVAEFFLFVEGKTSSHGSYSVLNSIPGVKSILRTQELEVQQANSRIWNETWLEPFFYKPCNYELFVKQTLNMESAIVMGKEANMDWIIHLDTDELIYPAKQGQHYSVQRLLSDVPKNVDMVVFPNYESAVERDDVIEPFSEVTMFKKNYDHLASETHSKYYGEASRGNPSYFITYENGKSAARVQEHLRPHGAHRWHNYMKSPKETKFEEAAVLHYTYAKFSDLNSRRDRCGCKPIKDVLERCFMLDFDRTAFAIASTGTEEEMLHWYRKQVVWSDKELKSKLLMAEILTRIYTPMVIIKSLRESGIFSSVIASSEEKGTSEKELPV